MTERNQATGGDGKAGAPDGTNVTPGSGESGGGAREGKEAHGDGGAHGGQTRIDYHGPGQLGDEKTDDRPDNNATTEGG